MEYENLDIRFIPLGNGQYRADIIRSLAGEAGTTFTPPKPLTGETLFRALFTNNMLVTLIRSVDKAKQNDKGLRIRLRLGETPELAQLPWETLRDPERAETFALSNRTPIVRYLELPEGYAPLAIDLPLRILCVIATPKDYPPLNVQQAWDDLKTALQPLQETGLVELTKIENQPFNELQTLLRNKKIHVVHFIGHGETDPASGGALVFSRDNRSHKISGELLGTILRDEETLRLVVMNACNSATADENPFSGTAQRLVQKGVPAVIAMQRAITDRAALAFDREYYKALAEGYPVDFALSEGRKRMNVEGHATEWDIPALFMRAPDGRLFTLPNAPAPRTPPTRTPTHSPVEIERASAPPPREITAASDTLAEYPQGINALREALAQGRLTLFIGADLPESITGALSHQELADGLAAQHGLPPGQSLAATAQLVMSHQNRFAFTNFLKEKLRGAKPGALYAALADFVRAHEPEMLVTTCYHQLLERALTDRGYYQLQAITDDGALSFVDTRAPALLKLYGDIQQTDMVVTEQDESALLRGRDPKRREMLDEVTRLFKRTTILFLGHDLTSPTLRMLFDDVAGGKFQRPAYAVWPGIPAAEQQALASNRGLTVLDVDANTVLHTLTTPS